MRPIPSFAEAPAPVMSASHPPGWHSPVPYLFGGLAAMLGLIAFALLILACSYWKLSGFPPEETADDPESGDGEREAKKAATWENNVLVIMAGQVLPTFLATPSTSRSSSFGDTTASNSGGGGGSTVGSCDGEKDDKVAVELSESVAGVVAADVEDHRPVADVSV